MNSTGTAQVLPIYTVTEARETILKRRAFDDVAISPAVQQSLDTLFGQGTTPNAAVEKILADIRAEGDTALFRYARDIDGMAEGSLEVSEAEINEAVASLDPKLVAALELAADQITRFHQRQSRQSWVDFSDEGALGQLIVPLERVGLYAPGGTAPLPSSLLMAAIPARAAGVNEIICCSPPQRETGKISPVVLAAARIAGVHRVFRIGGAQAIGAMAYGTASVPRVDKIAGPGNIFVVLAKRAVYGTVGIEALPGPTETMVIADDTANPTICAADLLAQAEHDVIASAIMLTTSEDLARQTQAEAEKQIELLDRKEIARQSMTQRSGIVLVQNLDEAFELANSYAPEHLCLLVRDPWQWVGSVKNAGGIFLGETSFEVLGDYTAGPSHIMPTGGTARYASPVNVDDFRKIISLIGLNEKALARIGPAARTIAEAEGLTGHAKATQLRLQDK